MQSINKMNSLNRNIRPSGISSVKEGLWSGARVVFLNCTTTIHMKYKNPMKCLLLKYSIFTNVFTLTELLDFCTNYYLRTNCSDLYKVSLRSNRTIHLKQPSPTTNFMSSLHSWAKLSLQYSMQSLLKAQILAF